MGLDVAGLTGVDGVVGLCATGFVCDDCLEKACGLVGEHFPDL